MSKWYPTEYEHLSKSQINHAPPMFPMKSREVRENDLLRFIEIAKKEHYNTPNYGKYFIV